MSFCMSCQRAVGKQIAPGGECPWCGGALGGEQRSARWSPVARLRNLAEVGYFADVLEGQGIATRVHQHDEFSAVDGQWRVSYVLQAAHDRAADAVELLKREVDSDESEAWPASSESSTLTSGGGAWKQVAFVVLAGGLAYFAGRGDLAPARRGPASDPLRQALSESSATLESQPAPGHSHRRLRFEPESGFLLLEDDFDRDGTVDRTRRFEVQR